MLIASAMSAAAHPVHECALVHSVGRATLPGLTDSDQMVKRSVKMILSKDLLR